VFVFIVKRQLLDSSIVFEHFVFCALVSSMLSGAVKYRVGQEFTAKVTRRAYNSAPDHSASAVPYLAISK